MSPPVVLAFGLRPERLLEQEPRIDCFMAGRQRRRRRADQRQQDLADALVREPGGERTPRSCGLA